MERRGGGGGEGQGQEFVPEGVKQFIKHFRSEVNTRNVPGILSVYERLWPMLTEKYYSKDPWPSAELVQEIILPEKDEVFMVLYKELYYRHINTKLTPSLAQRVYAWENYSDLFYNLLGAKTPGLELPVQWLWDIIDEFIYQYESWCQYVNKLSPAEKTDEEIAYLKENTTIWNVTSVIGYLEYLKAKSNIIQWLERGGERGLVANAGESATGEYDFSNSETYRMLGYFCIVGQMRLHCLFRDYHLALKEIAPIELSDQGLYARVPACHVNLSYFMGFTYFMMRRYTDAIQQWVSILTMVEKQSARAQDQQMTRRTDKMFGLLAIALTLCPTRTDDTVTAKLMEKHGERMQQMRDGNEEVFADLLKKSSPRNISPAPPNFNLKADQHMNASKMQHKFFLNEVVQHASLPSTRDYLKLYSSVDISKLADFDGVQKEEFRTRLLALKHKSRMVCWKSGAANSGEDQQASEVEFYIDKVRVFSAPSLCAFASKTDFECLQDVVHVSEAKISQAHHHSEFFIHHIGN
jgi:translation initiation factor 3 subunit L